MVQLIFKRATVTETVYRMPISRPKRLPGNDPADNARWPAHTVGAGGELSQPEMQAARDSYSTCMSAEARIQGEKYGDAFEVAAAKFPHGKANPGRC
jgi:hypothetical protein